MDENARGVASDLAVEVPVMLDWLRERGHAAEDGLYKLSDRDVEEIKAHADELRKRNEAWLEKHPGWYVRRPLPKPDPDKPVDPNNPFAAAQRMGRRSS